MSAIMLESPTYEITAINRKTSAETMRGWKVGDQIRFRNVMEAVGGASGGGVYASHYMAINMTRGQAVTKSQTNMAAFFTFDGKYGVFTIKEVAK